jgi:ABC-2 type transport system ATP-binding protein
VTGIDVEDLSKHFGSRTAVEGITFRTVPGEVFGLLGPNGAGKTTTVRMLTGLLTPSGGRGQVCGFPLGGGDERLRRVVGLLTEQPGLYDRLTVRENLEFFIRLNELDTKEAWARAERYLEMFGLKGRESDPCGSFSKGMRQKLALIRALVHAPQVLFLDEPTSGLDPEAARTVRDCVAELASEGRTLILCSHNLAEVERLCTRVAVIKNRLLAVGPLAQLQRTGGALEVRLEGEAEPFRATLQRLPFPLQSEAEGTLLKVWMDSEAQVPDVVAELVRAGARIQAVARRGRPLEEVYLELVRS